MKSTFIAEMLKTSKMCKTLILYICTKLINMGLALKSQPNKLDRNRWLQASDWFMFGNM